ncbi:hypothetical protein CS562_12540 [Paenibacillus sp. LK1]|nr:hypothetical protein CS562_12540 [Paenibacillus sp. LK1]
MTGTIGYGTLKVAIIAAFLFYPDLLLETDKSEFLIVIIVIILIYVIRHLLYTDNDYDTYWPKRKRKRERF